jgi:hypothetical protein
MGAHPDVTALIGVYHADGGPIGEAKYVLGRSLGTAHCALCDITHSPVRRKPAWDQMVDRLGLPFALVHLNEMAPDVAEQVAANGSPVVLGRRADGCLTTLLSPDQLEVLGGSLPRFESLLVISLQQESARGSVEAVSPAPADPRSPRG